MHTPRRTIKADGRARTGATPADTGTPASTPADTGTPASSSNDRNGRRPRRLRTALLAAATLAATATATATATAVTPAITPAGAATGGGHLALSTESLSFYTQRAGTAWRAPSDLKLTNDGDAPLTLRSLTLTGDLAGEFWFDSRCPQTLAPGTSCELTLGRAPLGSGPRAARLVIDHDGTNPATGSVSVWGPATAGFYVATTTGKIYGYGDAGPPGSMQGDTTPRWQTPAALNAAVLDLEATPTGDGVWVVAGDGGIFTFGDAAFHGSTGDLVLNKPIVGMAATTTGRGYWLVASDGGIFTFGDATFLGSTGDTVLNKPIVGMAATSTGKGYWLVASDGGIFTFGDAAFHGSTGDIRLNQPITAMGRTPKGDGYWLLASDGGVFTFGNALFHGSKPVAPNDGSGPRSRAVGLAVAPGGTGYWVAYARAYVDAFGDVGGNGGALPPSIVAAVAPSAPAVWWPDPRNHAALRQAFAPSYPAPTMSTGTIG